MYMLCGGVAPCGGMEFTACPQPAVSVSSPSLARIALLAPPQPAAESQHAIKVLAVVACLHVPPEALSLARSVSLAQPLSLESFVKR